jgi:hypothetical protein
MKIPAGDSLIAPASWQATFSKCRTGACWMEEPESAPAPKSIHFLYKWTTRVAVTSIVHELDLESAHHFGTISNLMDNTLGAATTSHASAAKAHTLAGMRFCGHHQARCYDVDTGVCNISRRRGRLKDIIITILKTDGRISGNVREAS